MYGAGLQRAFGRSPDRGDTRASPDLNVYLADIAIFARQLHHFNLRGLRTLISVQCSIDYESTCLAADNPRFLHNFLNKPLRISG